MDLGIQTEVSLIIPVRNEEKHLHSLMESILKQDYPPDKMEILFIDGMSIDKSAQIIDGYRQEKKLRIRLFKNEKIKTPCAMNIGIKNAKGKYIVRMDAHSTYAPDYVSKCIEYLLKTGAQNVGGMINTISGGYVGEAIALMLSCRFGVGNARFRVRGADGYTDTVPFGAYKKDVFQEYGMYDEKLERGEDIELNHRICQKGGKIYFTKDIKSNYYSRDTVEGITSMAYANGSWVMMMLFYSPGSRSLRHYVPFVFVLSLLILSALSFLAPIRLLLFSELIIYMTFNLIVSLWLALKSKLRYFPFLILLFPLFHVSYGIGSIAGIFKKKVNKL